MRKLLLACNVIVFLSSNVAANRPQWQIEFGTPTRDEITEIAVDELGHLYALGITTGDLAAPNQGSDDVYLSRYDTSGQLIWRQQFGTDNYDQSQGVAVDGLGNVYIAGGTHGDLFGDNQGSGDAFLAKIDEDGTLLWSTQFGSRKGEYIFGIAVDQEGSIIVGGDTYGTLGGPSAGESDMFVAKFRPDGQQEWLVQPGVKADERFRDIAVDAEGNIYASRHLVDLDMGDGGRASLTKLAPDGTVLWSQDTFGGEIATDQAGNVYTAGWRYQMPNREDAFLQKLDEDGTQQWTLFLSSDRGDIAQDIKVASDGTVYVAGTTAGTLFGDSHGGDDIFVAKINQDGELLWGEQFGSASSEREARIDTVLTTLYLANIVGPYRVQNVSLARIEPRASGDVNGDGQVSVLDIEALTSAIRRGSSEHQYDINLDGVVSAEDRFAWIHDVQGTWIGDANLDGEFNSSDFVQVFTFGKFETNEVATWDQGDWNGDQVFSSSDFVVAFQDGGYENGPRAAVSAVPEPNSLALTLASLVSLFGCFRRRCGSMPATTNVGND